MRGVWHACRRGLDAIDDHRATLGSTELRARASVRGDELARLALTRAVDAQPRTLLWWSERWRATALAQPPVRPPRDPEVASLFAMLRANERRLSEARDDDEPTASPLNGNEPVSRRPSQHRRRLVAATNGYEPGSQLASTWTGSSRRSAMRRSWSSSKSTAGYWSVVGGGGRAAAAGGQGPRGAVAAVDSARFVLRQAARGRPVRLHDLRARLQATLVGPSAAVIGSGQVVVSPTGRPARDSVGPAPRSATYP